MYNTIINIIQRNIGTNAPTENSFVFLCTAAAVAAPVPSLSCYSSKFILSQCLCFEATQSEAVIYLFILKGVSRITRIYSFKRLDVVYLHWKGCGWKWSWPNLRYYPGIC
jgi:hypothetical protein